VSLPRNISPAAAARRSLLVDLPIAIALAALFFQLAAGIGVVAVFALLTLVALSSWIAIEAVVRRTSRRRKAARQSTKRKPMEKMHG
jgi:uncharacterized protein (DUF58 family)